MPFSARQGLFGQAAAVGPVIDADVSAWAANVATADGQSLESGVISAVNTFVTGVKSDGDWTNLDQILILNSVRTLAGAAVPLKGTAPTFYNFVSGDLNRTTGIAGNTTNKYIDSNYAMNTWSPGNIFVGAYQTQARTSAGAVNQGIFGSADSTSTNSQYHMFMNQSSQVCVVTRYFNTNPKIHNAGGTGTQVDYDQTQSLYALYSNSTSAYTVSNETQTDTVTQAQGTASANNLYYYTYGAGTITHYNGTISLILAGNYVSHTNLKSRADTLYSDIAALGL
jgi:hypothetical protein